MVQKTTSTQVCGYTILSLSLPVLTAIFQVTGLAGVYWSKGDRSGGDNWTTGAIRRAKLQSNHHHQQTNIIQFFTGRMPFLSPNSVKALKGYTVL